MNKKKLRLLSTILIILLCLSNSDPVVFAATLPKANSAWVLTEIVGYEYADRWTKADEHPSYAVKYSYSNGVYTASTTYEGDDSSKKGTLGLKAIFNGVPDVIYPNQSVSLNLSFSTTENSVINLSFSGWASADFDQWDLGSGSRTRNSVPFVNADGNDSFIINVAKEPYTYNETLTAQLGTGKEGSRIALRTKFNMGAPMGTNYIYEWKPVSESVASSSTTVSSSTKTTTPANSTTTTTPTSSTKTTTPTSSAITTTPSKSNNWWWNSDDDAPEELSVLFDPERSIVRFGDLHGEVNVKRADEDDDAWVFAELGTPLRHGDMIKTLPKSGAILSFSDGSTFVMKPDTVIILDIKNESETKIGILAGKIWTNMKAMVKDGSMEVEMAQAVAGIKGTTFICEAVDGVSTLKVFEGTVAYTARSNGETIMVSDGQMINASTDGLSRLTTFDMEEELNSWEDSVRTITAEALTSKKNKFNLAGLLMITIALLMISFFAFIVIYRKRKKTGSH